MHSLRWSQRTRFLVALAVLGLGACSDARDLTRPTSRDPNRLITCGDGCGGGGGGGGGSPPPPPNITIQSLRLAYAFTGINAGTNTYTATIYNPGGTLTGVVAQGYMTQWAARRAAGGTLVDCHAGPGVVPNGNCLVTFTAAASNTTAGTGTLVPGDANFELDIVVGGAHFTQDAGLYLVPGFINAFGPTTMTIGGAPSSVTVTSENTGSWDVTGLGYYVLINQGFTQRRVTFAGLQCANVAFVLPAHTTCTQTISFSVSNDSTGSGTLVPGPATLQLLLDWGTDDIGGRSYPITLVAP